MNIQLISNLLLYLIKVLRLIFDKRFNLLTVVFTILLFGGFYLIRVVLH